MNQIPGRFPTRSADLALAGMLDPVTGIIQLEMSIDYSKISEWNFLPVSRLGLAFIDPPLKTGF